MRKFIFFNIILIILIVTTNVKSVFANNDEGVSDIFSGGDKFIQSANLQISNNTNEDKVDIDASKLKDFSNTMANALIGIGTAIAVIYSVVLGIKFMIGSMEEKAEIKESLVPFIIGCAVLFGAYGIWKIVVSVGNRL